MRQFALSVTLVLLAGCNTSPAPFDILIRGGLVLDGTGAPAVRADIGILRGRIAQIGVDLDSTGTGEIIDATGFVIAPGFVDIHAHLDPLHRLPGAESHVRQGVTTALGGPDGGGPWPLGGYLDETADMGVGINVAFLAGHNSIRREVMGLAARAPSSDELDRMQQMVGQAMEAGAFGLSTGLKYIPGTFSDVDEVVALASVAAEHGGIYTSHLREEGLGLIEGVAEAMEIGARADITAILTHHKVVGQPMWGSSARTLAMVDSARAAGTSVLIDQYPYTASYTGIGILVPSWAQAGGTDSLLHRMDDPELADSILAGTAYNIVTDRGGNDLRRVQFALVEWDRTLEGQTLADWAIRLGRPLTPESGAELVIEALRRGGASCVFHAMDEADVRAIMRHPQTAIASDGRLVQLGDGHPHPRWYGTFPRVLGHYVRQERVLELPEAVRKMTSLPAGILGLEDRGQLRTGWAADIVIFDPETVMDLATFDAPHQYPAGIQHVIVNGIPAVRDGVFTDRRDGVVLRKGD